MNIIDYSQFKEWQFCPWKWYEKYVLQNRKAPKPGQQDNALTLGTLVHAGLEQLRKTGKPSIIQEVIEKADPKPECLTQATGLLLGYIKAYPKEDFTHYYCEEPLRFGLTSSVEGLAKVDCYFELTEPATINSGLGDSFVLNPGVWVHEYKTKDSGRNTANWIEAWKVNMQASFQILALQERLGKPVQGLLVNVLEKAKPYQPKRTCKGCGVANELRDWQAQADGRYTCPSCAFQQVLDTSNKSRTERNNNYFRIMVQRNADELAQAKQEMIDTANEMDAMRQGKPTLGLVRATERCVHEFYGPCDYYAPHVGMEWATGKPGFVQVEALGYLK